MRPSPLNFFCCTLLLFLCGSLITCMSDTEGVTQASGQQLFVSYCKGCHASVDPKYLPKHIWEGIVLPRMGTRLGMYTDEYRRDDLIEKGPAEAIIKAANIYPLEPILDTAQWRRLKEYVLATAPDSLIVPDQDPGPVTDQWSYVPGAYRFSPPSTTLVSANADGSIYIGDANTGSISRVKGRELLKQANIGEGAVSIVETPTRLMVLTMGSFSPTDTPLGKLISLPKSSGKTQVLADSLQRPVHMDIGDIDGDGDADITIAEFGKWTGGLTLLRSEAGRLTKEKIDYSPGCTKAYIRDIDQDGDQDIVALFAQGDERITAYLSEDGRLQRQDLVPLQPSMGSSYLDVTDWDDDGDLDLLYCAGDNADYSPILKPYHGVYVYEQKLNLTFEQKIHLPLHGAYKAIADDFDGDGDMDIAAISFFPQWDRPRSGFAYYEQVAGEYKRHSLLDHEAGRWIVMDRGDVTDDGKTDLILGALTLEAPGYDQLVGQWMQGGVGYALLVAKK